MTDARSELAAVLLADDPHASLGDQARIFDRFAGTWDCDYTHFAADGAVAERYPGQLVFGWIIDGRAMQDVWIGYPAALTRRARSIGTSVRFFDATSGLWKVVFIMPEAGVITTVTGGAVGDRIVLEGENLDHSLRRWSFNDIRPDSFTWRGERSEDEGKTWRTTAEYQMTRPGSQPASPSS